MSLINEALKNAQRESQGDSAPAVRDAHISDARDAGGVSQKKVALLVMLVALVGGVAWFLAKSEPEAPVVARTPQVKSPASEPKAPAAEVKPVAPAESPKVAPAPAVPVVAPAEPTLPVVNPAPVAPPVVAAPPAPQENPEVLKLVGLMNVSLARKATSRAVINGVVVKVGDILSDQPKVVLHEIRDTSVVFTDAAGVRYEKRYK